MARKHIEMVITYDFDGTLADGNTDLELRDPAVEVPCRDALAQQFHAVHSGLDAAPAVVAAPSSPERTTKVFRRPQGLVAGACACRDGLPGLCILAGWNDGVCPSFGDGIMALSGDVKDEIPSLGGIDPDLGADLEQRRLLPRDVGIEVRRHFQNMGCRRARLPWATRPHLQA